MGKSSDMFLQMREAESMKSSTSLVGEPEQTERKTIKRRRDLLMAPMPYKWRVQSFSKNKPVANKTILPAS